ncbi:Progestin and adipoQ receptor family member 4 [Halotydeus destructor]|nr:Progestin and adipoQ receptor family member 4 [Halotydeus destructor]
MVSTKCTSGDEETILLTQDTFLASARHRSNSFKEHHGVTMLSLNNNGRAPPGADDFQGRGRTLVEHDWSDKKELCSITDVPKYLRFNPYILTGYRSPQLTYSQCLYSLCYFHNETLNIMTHVISLAIFVVYMPNQIPWEEINYKWLPYTHIIGSFSSWIGSSVYHLFMNHKHGEQFYFDLLRWDVVGIWVTQAVGASTTVYTSVYRFPLWLQIGFIGVYVILSLRALKDSMVANSPSKRVLGFAYLFAMRIIAFGMRRKTIQDGDASPLIHIVMQEIWPVLGSCIAAARVPERWFPGKFDLWLNSHNLMHVLVVLGALHMHWATCSDLIWLSKQ